MSGSQPADTTRYMLPRTVSGLCRQSSSVHTHEDFSFPITLDTILPVTNSTFGLTVATKQNYNAAKYVSSDQGLTYFNVVSNSVQSSDVIPP